MGKFPYLSSTESIIHYPFKHLFYERSSLLVYANSAFFAHGSSSNQLIANRYASGSHTKFAFSSQSSLHILRSVIIFEFGLATEDHEKEFLIGVVGEARSVCTNLDKYSCIHHVDNRSQISCISGKSIRCPGKDSIVLSLSETVQKLHIDSSLPWSFRWFALGQSLYNFQSFLLCDLVHLRNLRIYWKCLFFIGFRWFSCVQTVFERYVFHTIINVCFDS